MGWAAADHCPRWGSDRWPLFERWHTVRIDHGSVIYDVFRLLAAGMSNSEIAHELVASMYAVRSHVASILMKSPSATAPSRRNK
jgi:hypothetical protein